MAAALRQVVLSLIKSLLMPLTAATNLEAGAAAKANGTAFVESGGVQLLVDMLTGKTLVTRTLPQPFNKEVFRFHAFSFTAAPDTHRMVKIFSCASCTGKSYQST